MSLPEPETDSREAQAMREVGRTDVSPRLARVLTAAFLTVLVGVAAAEIRRDVTGPSRSAWRELASATRTAGRVFTESGPLAFNRKLRAAMVSFEDSVNERSILTARLGRDIQWNLTRRLNTGTDQVVKGRKGWLFFRPAVDYLTGPGFLEPAFLSRRTTDGPTWKVRVQPDPVLALADFAAQLAERGIGLVVVPTPVKAAIHPEGLASGLEVPLRNPSFATFLGRLDTLGIPAYAPGEVFAKATREKPWALFLRTDTHWTPQAMELAAEGLAASLRRSPALRGGGGVRYTRREAWVKRRGDLAELIRVPMGREIFPLEVALTQQVLGNDGNLWKPGPSADVLVLGDSFTNIYSQAELGFGESAGFAEQLSYFLGRPVDKLAVNAGGPTAVRERLAADLLGGTDRLAGKRLVVYQFSERELSSGDWALVDLSPPASGQSGSRAAVRRPEQALPARGFVVWESNRSGDWRIWTRRLEGGSPRQLSKDEPGRQHCCAHLSPDGSQIAYLSRSVPKDEYPELEVAGDLRLLKVGSGEERTVVVDARPYGWGNRAVVWRNDRELIYIQEDGRTLLLDSTTGVASVLSGEPRVKLAWLMDATLAHAVNGSPTFSPYDLAARRIDETERRSGCEPYFSHDGRFGFWVERAGGPVRTVELATGKTGVLLENLDPRIPGAQRYAYFPMLSRDGRMFAFGASAGDHDHFTSNYDIFVSPVDPASLEMLGRPQRMTSHPGSDRYPDVHVESLDIERWRRGMPPVPVADPTPDLPHAQSLEARAVLRACSRTPSLREISPYRSALIVCEWDVAELLEGKSSASRLRVAHWGLRDGERQPITTAASGFTIRLGLEPMVGPDQTEGFPIFDTLPKVRLPVHYARKP